MPDIFSTLDDVDSRAVLDYTSRDFTAVRAQLVGLAKGLMPEWTTAGEPSDFGTLILELFAYMGDVMHFYIDRTASEAFLGTALRRQSVLYIADMLGYSPIGQQAASVRLLFSLDAAAPDPVTLPAGTRIYNDVNNSDDLIVFELLNSVTLAPGDGSDKVLKPAIEGFGVEGLTPLPMLLGTSQGTPNTEFVIPDKGVVYGSVSIQSREGPSVISWTYITDLSLARPAQAVFTTFIDDAEYTHIIFGDNASGRVPPVNAEIFVTYRFGVGAEANDLALNTLTVLALSPTTTSSSEPVDLWGVSVTNPESPVGGTDPESIDAMRYSIPRAAARLKNRAITLNDYADLALQVPGVAKSMSHGTVYTAVHVRIAPTQGEATDQYMLDLCEAVERYMADKVIVGSVVYAEPNTAPAGTLIVDQLWDYVYIRAMVHVQDSYNRTTVRAGVEHVIRQMLAFDNVDFETRVAIGNVYRSALAVQGVEWIDLFWLDDAAPTTVRKNTVTNKALTTNVATLTIGTHPYVVGNQVVVAGVDAVFNGTQTITAIAATTISYAKTNANVVSVAATGTVSSLPPSTATVTNKVLTANVATLTIGAHTFYVGDVVRVLGVDTVFDGYQTITALTATTISYAKSNANVLTVAATGKVTPQSVNIWNDDDQRVIGDVIPSELLIPKIDPTSVVETVVNFPGLSVDELTHDGLWVQATGGLQGT